MYYYLEGNRNTMTSTFIESVHGQPSESTWWLYLQQGASATMTATATKTSVKKSVRAGSNFIAFIPSRSTGQMLANLSGGGF